MIDAKTTLCIVIGKPIKHSLSPEIHNASYRKLGLNYCFLACEVSDVKHALLGVKALNIKGVSITIPHKQKVLKYLNKIDPQAQKIGAVNTIVNRDGKLYGYNTDVDGALTALKNKTDLSNKKVALLGCGGAARAIAAGLIDSKAKVTAPLVIYSL